MNKNLHFSEPKPSSIDKRGFDGFATCTKCKAEKSTDDFIRTVKSKKGFIRTILLGPCRSCRNMMARPGHRAYYEKNREKFSEKSKVYREKKREKIKVRQKAYYEKNREQILAKNKVYREKNREEIKVRGKAYYEKNREKFSEKSKVYREKNLEQIKARDKSYRERNSIKLSALKKDKNKRLTDTIVKRSIYRGTILKSNDIPQSLINLKRTQMLLNRLIKRKRKLNP